jgi:hypothetical protein
MDRLTKLKLAHKERGHVFHAYEAASYQQLTEPPVAIAAINGETAPA